MWLIDSALIGVAAGWLAGRVLRANGYGIMGNIAAGILGAVTRREFLADGGREARRMERREDARAREACL